MTPFSSLRGQLVVVVAVLAVLLAGAGVGALVAQERSVRASDRLSAQWLPALVAVERLQNAYIDQQTAVRGYLLTGNEELLEPFRASQQTIGTLEGQLHPVLMADGSAAGNFEAVRQAHAEWLRRGAEPAIAVRTGGGEAEVRAFVAARTGRGTFDELRARVVDLRASVEATVASESGRTAAVRTSLNWWLGALVTLGLLVVVLAVVGVRRAVTRPLGELLDAVAAVGRGDLERPVVVRGPQEFVTVSESVDRMRRSLNEHRSSAVDAAAQEAELRESERVAAELQEGVVRRLFGISTALTTIVNRHPGTRSEVLRCVHDIDETISDVRAAAVGRLAGATAGDDVVGRIVVVLESAPDLIGVHPAVRVAGHLRRDVSSGEADQLAGGLRDTLTDLAVLAGRGGVDGLEVEVFSDGTAAGLRITVGGITVAGITVSGPGPGGAWSIVERAAMVGGRCSVTAPDDGHTVLEWVLPPRR